MPITSPGKMNERITFYKEVVKKNDYGDKVKDKEKYLECWAAVKTQFLSDIQASIGTVLEDTLTFVIRHQHDKEITNDLSVKYRNSVYEIIKINPDVEYKKFDTIISKEVT
ncbi:phage head closure protein [Heyndrickxia coagulans]|uniref:phage head closure protein n=1 Tax=Heyndrickxia coagulans TaxID=1398 RepID=UPI000CE2A8AF|nr:phage head closure protein [Heyndrickxia coagulans]AVD56214.1 head-tail adaptor protein [Heyndrickxia coagulans]